MVDLYGIITRYRLYPIPPMYDIFTYIYHKHHPFMYRYGYQGIGTCGSLNLQNMSWTMGAWLGPILWTSHPWNEHNKTGAFFPIVKRRQVLVVLSFGIFPRQKNGAKLWTDHKAIKVIKCELTYYQYYQLPSPCLWFPTYCVPKNPWPSSCRICHRYCHRQLGHPGRLVNQPPHPGEI